MAALELRRQNDGSDWSFFMKMKRFALSTADSECAELSANHFMFTNAAYFSIALSK